MHGLSRQRVCSPKFCMCLDFFNITFLSAVLAQCVPVNGVMPNNSDMLWWGHKLLRTEDDRVRTHLREDDDFITSGKTDENIPASRPPLRVECISLQTEKQLLDHTNRETAFFFFALTYVRGSAGRALFVIAIDLLSLFRQPPRPV